MANSILGATDTARKLLLQRGGLTIRTTVDPKMQRAAQKAVDQVRVVRPEGTPVEVEQNSGHQVAGVQPTTPTAPAAELPRVCAVSCSRVGRAGTPGSRTRSVT